ncbi:hypothetical protein GPECTOR_23g148 [Gonium pectorale]|uniref:phytol kinase n=1 Tax=Gonium pectorale TaxID=33097 RepID=A0A150GGZ6_GONPE|nr:hypothetical protein GPECTOR_23g148 [Gonium pectorale]|eukprot:KXZ49063.1 hypothetical protein GPECTOR_23g148 [Gonium pectorale]
MIYAKSYLRPDLKLLHQAASGPACLPLLCLLAASLRLSPHELSGEGVRPQLCCEIAFKAALSVTYLLMPQGLKTGLLLALLRGDTLQAAGRQLAALAGSPEAAEAITTAAEGQGELPPSAVGYAAVLLELVYTLISKACLASQAPEAFELRDELAAALEGSQALEHAGRALLLLRAHWKGARLASGLLETAAFCANSAQITVMDLQKWCRVHGADDGAGGQLAARLHAVASGRCARHAALCLGLAVLCDADGGPALGMPPGLLAAPPTERREHAPGSRAMSVGAATQLRGMVRVLGLAGTAPPGRRAALALMLRVGWVAVDSARDLTAADKGGDGRGSLAARGPRRIVAAEGVLAVALGALGDSRPFVPQPTGVPERDSLRAAEAEGWWRLATAIATDVLPYATADCQPALLGRILDLPEGRLLTGQGTFSLPPEPPPEVAAALGSGLLRCVEHLMRRAGRDPQGPEAAVLRELGHNGDRSLWPYLALLLAYGEPRQAAALLATMRKVLRTAGVRATVAEWASEGTSHQGSLQAVLDILYDAPLMVATPVAPGEGISPALQQLLRLLCCAACEWLPELARAVLSEEPSEALSGGVPVPILNWLQLLAACCASQPGTTASSPPAHQTDCGATVVSGSGAGPVTGSEAAAGGDDGGWRALLLGEVGAVPLLDAALRLVPLLPDSRKDTLGPNLRDLVRSCWAVAVIYTGPVPPASGTGTARQGQSALDEAAAAKQAEGAAMGQASAAAIGEASAAAGSAGSTDAGDITPARPPLPWRAGLLREASTQLRSFGDHYDAAHAEVLASYLERGGRVNEGLRVALREAWPLASALPPPVEARRLLPARCANPACANLEGDSEADLTLKACAGCGAVGYCCRPCQLEHWREGHKEACGRMRGGGA